jgi:solute carrier family 25 carnitine/acylcarnitine transporter 20/29
MWVIKMDLGMYFLSYIQGGISGMIGVTLSHPFDTIKTHLQDGLKPPRNIKQLYRGLLPPFMGVGIEKSIVFGTYKNTNKFLKDKHFNKTTSSLVAGGVSGFTASFIVTPAERMKILLQSGQRMCGIHTLYKGFSATLTREMPGFAIYFTTYEHLYNNKMGLLPSFLCGSFSGAVSWVFIYPQDMIKTRIQSNLAGGSYMYHVKDIYYQKGLCGFYRGFQFAMMRAIPLHGATFFTFELLEQLKQDYQKKYIII